MNKFLLGVAVAATIAWLYEKGDKVQLREALIDDMNLRTDLINWIVEDGIMLTPEEFRDAFKEKSAFINLVAVRNYNR